MSADVTKYFKLFNLEMEDLVKDVDAVISVYRKRLEKGELTNYVFLENVGLFKHEKSALELLKGCLQTVDPSRFSTVDELIQEILEVLKKACIRHDLPRAVFPVLERKTQKIRHYLLEQEKVID